MSISTSIKSRSTRGTIRSISEYKKKPKNRLEGKLRREQNISWLWRKGIRRSSAIVQKNCKSQRVSECRNIVWRRKDETINCDAMYD